MPLKKRNNHLKRLKSKTLIDQLFLKGEGVRSGKLLLRFVKDEKMDGLYAGVSVTKRRFGRAVDRNRIKRQLRVALKSVESDLSCRGYCMLIYQGKKHPETSELMSDCTTLFSKID